MAWRRRPTKEQTAWRRAAERARRQRRAGWARVAAREKRRKALRRWAATLRPWRKVGVFLVLAGGIIWVKDFSGWAVAPSTVFGSGSTFGNCAIVSVIDGDTLRIRCGFARYERARLMGFDTPEIYSPKCISEHRLGTRATWFLRSKLFTADRVQLFIEGTDRYDRRLARMRIDGRDVAEIMIEAGYARPYSGRRRAGWC